MTDTTQVPTDEVSHTVDEHGIAHVTICRPHLGNSLLPHHRDALIDHIDAAAADLRVRVVLLSGAGDRHFCTGADLRTPRPEPERPDGAPERPAWYVGRNLMTGAQRLISAILDCDKPVIAAVNGTAAGMGVQLALACDLVVMAEEGRLIQAFAHRGIVPDAAAAYLLPRLVGVQRAKELLFLGDDIPAARAYELGLVNRVVPQARVRDEALALARRLAGGPTVSLGLTKDLVNRSLESDRTAAFRDEALAVEVNLATADAQEGLDAFRERRATSFVGW